ncbi:MAG: agmatinase [Nitrospirae bacterium]|nr:agmatinase [Nitrospirota bacterium]
MNLKLPHNFGGLPQEFSGYKDSKVVVLPILFDKTSSWLKGSDKGPLAIINASKNMELYDIETNSEIYKKGIYTADGIIAKKSKEMVEKAYKKVKSFLNDKKFVVVLGGEHTVSLGTVKAHAEYFKDLSILHLDAHSDMRDSYEGDKLSHACVMARVTESLKFKVKSSKLKTENIVSVGIRSMDSSELKNIKGQKIFYAEEIYKSKKWIKEVVRRLSNNVYVTIDLDVFDSSIMPSTGTPEPGGLTWYHVVDLLRAVSGSKNIVGFDVVELCPSKNKAPDFLAAKLIYKLLSFKFYLN